MGIAEVTRRVRDQPVFDERDKSLLLVLPGLFLFSAFLFYPVAYSVWLSLTNATPATLFNPERSVEFVGLENYAQILLEGTFTVALFGQQLVTLPINGQFWNSMGITWLFVATSVTLKVAFGVAIALVATHDRVRGKRLLRGLLIVPMGLPAIFTITVWRGIFSPAQFGLVNQLLGMFGFASVSWFSDRWMAFLAYNVTEMWLAYPFMVIITVSALQDVDENLYDAAKVDGAGALARFIHVTVPSIKRPVLFATILTSAASFQQFLIPFVFNRGGPARANELIIVYGYREAFANGFLGEGAAIMFLAVLFIGVFMWVNVKKGRLAEGVSEA